MYKHVFASVQVKCVCQEANTCKLHKPYTLHLICTVYNVSDYSCTYVCTRLCVVTRVNLVHTASLRGTCKW